MKTLFQFFEQRIEPFPGSSVTQPPEGLLAFCRHYTRGAERYLLIMAVLTGLTAILEVMLFDFMGQLVDWLATKDRETFLAEESGTLLRMATIVLIAIPLTVLGHSLVLHQSLFGNYPMAIRWNMHRYLLGQSFSFYQSEFAGRIATKLFQTALAVRESVIKVLDVLLYVGVYFASMVALVATSDPRLALPLLVWLMTYVSILYYFVPRLRDVSMRQANARAGMTGRIVDSYTNISTVKLFSHTDRESDYARESMEDFLETVHPQMRLITGLQLSVWGINSLLIFTVGSLAIYLWLHDTITPGAIAIAIALNLRLTGMSQWIMWEVSTLFEGIGTVQDGISTLSRPREINDHPSAPPLRISHGEIEFKQVCFDYDKHGSKNACLFENLDLVVKPGEKIGLIGRSGAGKSTLVNLLMRFYDIASGAIMIDKQSVSEVQQKSLRAAIGVVTQDTSLLHRSIRDNILYGRPDASEEEMLRAAREAHAEDFILQLTDSKGRTGFDAHVGERGVKLSGGQRQRIAIARVLLKNAPILILDEATSALDSEIEAAIQENLSALMQGKTVIAIAHRLSTIAAMDRLIVLEQGKIVEQGTHRDLLEQDGSYAQLWKRQSGGFLGDT